MNFAIVAKRNVLDTPLFHVIQIKNLHGPINHPIWEHGWIKNSLNNDFQEINIYFVPTAKYFKIIYF